MPFELTFTLVELWNVPEVVQPSVFGLIVVPLVFQDCMQVRASLFFKPTTAINQANSGTICMLQACNDVTR